MKIIDRIENVFISVSILIATLLVIVNVVLRVMGSGLTWSEELIRYFLIWVTFVGMSTCARDNEHMSIEFIPQMLKGTAQKIVLAIIYAVGLVFSILLIWYSYQLVNFSLQTGQVTSGLGIPISVIYFIIPISGILVAIRYLQQLIKLFSNKGLENTLN
ncbi:TRAP transporter small permease [Peribacillus saganii]|uniref:TRAP transporter small permease n=1 Tax=Peribacillus saganii TaxID=2303992 RepID=A0A372LQJ8_9BACI|nr:TRAP transporter small permease [Peribacillus saganii]RFU70503.1 TRAP transporter small permease [Peribacillus saganii]